MSKTVRKKNTFPRRWKRNLYNHFTGYDCFARTIEDDVNTKFYQTPEEFLRWWHGESSSSNSFSPDWYHRLRREKQLRMHNKMELHRWANNPEHEVMCKERPQNCWWDWM